MATPSFINTSNLPDNSTTFSPPGSSTSKRPAIRVLAGPLRPSYRPFPILLDASDPLVQESETRDDHFITLVGPQPPQQDSTRVNGVAAWSSQIRSRVAAFATRTIARLRRVLDLA